MAKITGTSAANTLKGKSTADDIYGDGGNDKLFGFFVGQVMKASQGKANPKVVNEILKSKLA